jgi:UDP-N-acetyl-alpha-D-muramoyl-L-alanyl-L-glutamate epimerase
MTDKFTDLRLKYPVFIYESFSRIYSDRCLKVKFRFIQSDDIVFEPEIVFLDCDLTQNEIDSLETAFFNLGMIELISYYKACCSPKIIVKCSSLNDIQIKFWKKIYFNGLGEFLYKNKIETTEDDLFEIHSENNTVYNKSKTILSDECLIPVGGGKDSVVSLEVLSGMNCLPVVLNPKISQTDSVKNSGYSSFFHIERTIDRKLLELNSKGYLNGHTPFSALLAFVSAAAALITKRKNIILSNENSASVGNTFFSGIEVNHQYSKSYEAEKALHDYISEYIHAEINYFSLLRPINELKIAEMFARYPEHFSSFRSCNAGSKENKWCGKCPKCLFTYIILSPFIDRDAMKKIFGSDLFDDKELQKTFFELTGAEGVKPFECVGTKEEVNSALAKTVSIYRINKLPYLLNLFRELNSDSIDKYIKEFDLILNEFNDHNLLNEKFKNILKKNL